MAVGQFQSGRIDHFPDNQGYLPPLDQPSSWREYRISTYEGEGDDRCLCSYPQAERTGLECTEITRSASGPLREDEQLSSLLEYPLGRLKTLTRFGAVMSDDRHESLCAHRPSEDRDLEE